MNWGVPLLVEAVQLKFWCKKEGGEGKKYLTSAGDKNVVSLKNSASQRRKPSNHTGSLVFIPVMGTSGLGCSFLHDGTNTVTSVWPLFRKKFTASWIPRQEKTSLFPWLKKWMESRNRVEKPGPSVRAQELLVTPALQLLSVLLIYTLVMWMWGSQRRKHAHVKPVSAGV